MKKIISKNSSFVFYLLLSFFILQEANASLGTKVRICAVKGTVQTGSATQTGSTYSCTLKQTLDKTECRVVNQETMIETGADGWATIQYQNGDIVKLQPNTKVVVQQNYIFIDSGKSWFKVEKGSDGKLFIKTPTAIAGAGEAAGVGMSNVIRSAELNKNVPTTNTGISRTEFIVEVVKDGTTKYGLNKGALEVTDANRQSKMNLTAGMEVSIAANSSVLTPGILNINKSDEWWTDWPTLVPIAEMPGYSDIPTSSSTSIGNQRNPIADSHVYAYSYANWNRANWGKYEVLGAGWNPIGGEKRAYLKFDVSGIDKSSIKKAVLKLYHYHNAGSQSAKLGVYTVRSQWIEGNGTYKPSNIASSEEICWNNQPSIDPYPVAYFSPGHGTNKFVEVDITTLVKSWLNGMPNYGLAIKADENYVSGPESMYGFYAREYKDVSKRPQLIINGGTGIGISQPEVKKNYSLTGKIKTDKINSFEIPNLGGKYAWEHTQNISILGEGAIVFEAKTVSDLTIGFAENIADRNSMYEIVIGAFGNAKALIRKGAQTPLQGHAQVGINTNKMASVPSNQWISYWASVKNGLVKFGRGKMVGQNEILQWQDPDPLHNIQKVGFSSWNTPIKFRNVAIYNTANPISTEGELNNCPEIDIEESMTIEKSNATYSWNYLDNVQLSGNAAFSFEAKATEDLTVCFAEERNNKSAMYEIVIGGWGNTRTVIRKFRQNPQFGFASVTVNENPDAMVTPGEWEKYWISVKNGLIKIGKGNEIGRRIILEWQYPDNPLEFISTIGLMCWNRPYEIRNIKILPIN